MSLSTPDITKAQAAAFATEAVAIAAAAGFHPTPTVQGFIVGGATLFAGALMWADAQIRKGRAYAVAHGQGSSLKAAVEDAAKLEIPTIIPDAQAALTAVQAVAEPVLAAPVVDAPAPVVDGAAVPAPATIGQPA